MLRLQQMTVRQMQRLLHMTRREPTNVEPVRVGQVTKLLGGAAWATISLPQSAVIRNGRLTTNCDCRACKSFPSVDITSTVDRLARKYGPDCNLLEALTKEAQAQQGQPDQQSQQGQQGQPDQQGQPQSGQPGQPGQSGESEAGSPTEQQTSSAEAARAQAAQRAAERQRQLAQAQAQAAAAKKLLKTAAPGSRDAKHAKAALRNARKTASFDSAAEAGGVSLVARKAAGRGLARLRAVPPVTRARMAAMICRLVGSGAASGGEFGPIPVLSARKLVKRMLVKRPLANALKEDVVTGRPVTLFLPDISPSCAATAQAACDIANAAGYAGVTGSDVLVLPHFNGDAITEEEYRPWFNGRPVPGPIAGFPRQFDQIVTGESRYKVQVVVVIGDHDGEDTYRRLCDLRSIRRMIWLHNTYAQNKRPREAVKTPTGSVVRGWPPQASKKLSVVYGCVNAEQMMRGFDIVTR